MDIPKPGPEHAKLAALAGRWKGEETIFPSPWDPAGGPATSRLDSRMDLDGFFLITDYVEERGGQVSYRGHGIYGWDPQERIYLMAWYDSMGGGHKSFARGRWDGNRLMFEQDSPMGKSRYLYQFEGDGRYQFWIEQSQDGKQWARFMEGRYSRL